MPLEMGALVVCRGKELPLRGYCCVVLRIYTGGQLKDEDFRGCYGSQPSTVEEILAIENKAGWKKGTKLTFPEKRNEQRGVKPSVLVFMIDEKPQCIQDGQQ
ncbi:dnaJ homolog subfamily B member 1 [Olea europaea subsp. europaea]|uniref:DnaJ homolog subfamily B member 1 n=1 Tax=Olea europaea subsp. europaea TaxID=158383 RepID=A0A8S0RKY4_OLEEU|nr:dnaJ homolog subfamily B member 1 [Olea europaea subsp. europaea]